MRRMLACLVLLAGAVSGRLTAQGDGPAPMEYDARFLLPASTPSALAGLKYVWLNVGIANDTTYYTGFDDLKSYVQLELRKTGIRILENGLMLSDSAGYMFVRITPVHRAFSTDWQVRFEVDRPARLTGDSIGGDSPIRLLPTWTHEGAALSANADSARAIVRRTTDLFLSDWLTGNGR